MPVIRPRALDGYTASKDPDDGTWAVVPVINGTPEPADCHRRDNGGFPYADARRIATRQTHRMQLQNRARKALEKAKRALMVSEAALLALQEMSPYGDPLKRLEKSREAFGMLLQAGYNL